MRSAILFGAILFAVAAIGLAGSHGAQADDRVVQVAIDMDVAGNGSNVLGPTEACNASPLQVGDTIDVDVVVRDVPEYVATDPPGRDPKGGIGGIDFNLLFDPSVVHVQSVQGFDGPTILKADGMYAPASFTDYDATENDNRQPPPGVTGNVYVGLVDLSLHYESGSGVATRITLEAVGAGVSRLELQNGPALRREAGVYASDTSDYQVDQSDAAIAVGTASCSDPTPTPFPTASPYNPVSRTPTTPTPGSTYDIRVDPATVQVGQDVTLHVRANVGTPGLAFFFVQLKLDHATFVSCASASQCDDATLVSGTIDIADQTAHVRTGDFEIAAITVHVSSPGIIAEIAGTPALQDLNGAQLQPLTVSNRYVTTVGITPPATPTPSPTATVVPTITATATPTTTPETFPPSGGRPASSEPLTAIAIALGVVALGVGFWLARRGLG